MALFIVLAILVLVSALVIGFFSSMTTEVKSSRSYASGVSSKQLADSAVQLVIAQITDATKGKDGGNRLAWASQPGMIRTYDQSGSPAKYYKLYSSDSLVQDGTGFDLATEAPPSDWNSKQGLFTDLNSPITRNGKIMFPILDGNSIKSLTLTESGKSTPAYLSYDANGDGKPDVEGFSIDPASVSYASGQSPSPTNNPVPMPVKWLYILQNGKLATPVTSASGTVSFDMTDAASVPSPTNPIVGRVAFWTDDDTCKLNINTASEGTFWDRPWANNITEQNFSNAIPSANEYQRFPGHPAKNSLSTVFGSLLPVPQPSWYFGMSSSQISQNQQQLKAYYDLIPRVAEGGTQAATITGVDASGNPNSAFEPVKPDSDRLYASADELFYKPDDRTNNNSVLDSAALSRSRFFITAHNRAPEINLLGGPRMTLWPLQNNKSERNSKDKLIAFCSEIAENPYYFQRYNSYSSSPTNASSQSATLDWTGVSRNQDLYRYLDRLTQEPIPGFGGSFGGKYPNSKEQILTEMFDLIRSGVNSYSTDLAPKYSYAPPYLSSGEGQVVPLVPPSGTAGAGTHGFGRFVTITGAAIVFYRSNPSYFQTEGTDPNKKIVIAGGVKTDVNPNGIVLTNAPQIGAALILNPFTCTPGFPPWSPHVQYVVKNLDNFAITSAGLNGQPANLKFGPSLKNTVDSRAEFSGQWNCTPFFGIISSFRYNAGSGQDGTKTVGVGDPVKEYAFAVPEKTSAIGAELKTTDQTFDFSGGDIVVEIYAGSAGAGAAPIQKINMNFPPVKGLAVPTNQPVEVTSSPSTASITFLQRINEGTGNALSKKWRSSLIGFYPIPTPTAPGSIVYAKSASSLGIDTDNQPVVYHFRDIARGIEAAAEVGPTQGPARGDYRIYAALNNVPLNYFTGCVDYDSTNADGSQKFTNVQSLRDESLENGSGAFGYDLSEPGGKYPHYPRNAAGNATSTQVAIAANSKGTLIPRNLLAKYGGGDGNGSSTGDSEYRSTARPAVPNGLDGALMSNDNYGDWDSAPGQIMDGPYINKPDEGSSSTVNDTSSRTNIKNYMGTTTLAGGYFTPGLYKPGRAEFTNETGSTLSPNRQVPSAVIFGSLPSGIDPSNPSNVQPWQTLLFCPNPAANSTPGAITGASHPGFGSPATGAPYTKPPDYLWLDLFTMPIVEPYAISEPFSTAGKVNMNYQIMPFSNITRSTAVRAVLKSTRITAIPQSVSTVTAATPSYKDGSRSTYEYRYDINPDETTGTLRGFADRFKNDIFRSAAEICSIYLVPKKATQLASEMRYPPGITEPSSYAATAAWWNDFLLTGDNVREQPYGDLYPRLTTKSNTYTVHYKVQTLKKLTSTPAAQWVENKDQVTGEVRGSSTVERYIDLGNSALPDFATDASASAEDFYKIHIISSTTFAP